MLRKSPEKDSTLTINRIDLLQANKHEIAHEGVHCAMQESGAFLNCRYYK